MKIGQYSFNVVQENLRATSSDLNTKKWMQGRLQLCWKCQKDKKTNGGSIKLFGSVKRFICKDCVEAKQAEIKGQDK